MMLISKTETPNQLRGRATAAAHFAYADTPTAMLALWLHSQQSLRGAKVVQCIRDPAGAKGSGPPGRTGGHMTKRGAPPPEKPPLRLLQPADKIRNRIDERVKLGKAILSIPIDSRSSVEDARKEYRKWSSYNAEMLRQVASNDELSSEYTWWGVSAIGGRLPLANDVEEFHGEVREKIHRLESIAGRLELIPLSDDAQRRSDGAPVAKAVARDSVFVVHGHDAEAREAVGRFIEKLGFRAVILHEEANKGMTLIEKLEANSGVGFAVVLLTPDDEGREAGSEKPLQPRARQNVVLELGYFVGKLGRKSVCALFRDVESPSDYLGVVYVPFDEGGAWQMRLARELRAAGFNVDGNLVL